MKRRPITALICSVPLEAALLLKHLKRKRTTVEGLSTGTLGDTRLVLMCSGMGIANAAHAATVIINKYSPARVVCFGIGGAYPGSSLAAGEVIFATKEVYADSGVLLPGGLRGLEATGLALLVRGRKKYYNQFPLDRALLVDAARRLGPINKGTFLTVSAVTGTRERAQGLRRRWGADCENMEGAAVAHVCAMYGVPAMELRGISNAVGPRDIGKWKKETAARAVQETLLRLL